jgi:hypothetical protein
MTDKSIPAVVEDFLDEDVDIPGQRYVLLSFISPEKVLEKKDVFFFKKFLESYEVDWKIKNLEKYMVGVVKNINDQLDERIKELEKNDQNEQATICRKNRMNITTLMSEYEPFIQKNRADIQKTTIVEAYDNYMFTNKTKLEDEYYALNEFRTSVRGLKVRGVYGNPKEAELKAKKLQSKDKYHNIFIGDLGKWLPWDPQPHEIADQEYAQDELNTLMRKYKENEDNRDKFFEERSKSGGAAAAASTKQVFGGGDGPSSTFGSMFGGTGDVALQRKMEKAAFTVEKVTDATNTVENTVVQNTVVQNTVTSMTNLDFKNGVVQPEPTTPLFGKLSEVNYE